MPSSHREIAIANGDIMLVNDLWDCKNPKGAVALLHGGGQTRHSWSPMAQRLNANGWQVLNMDLRGHGDSSWSADGDYSCDSFVDDVSLVVSALQMPPVLVGASLGGRIAAMAQTERRLGTGVVMVDLVPHARREGVTRIRDFMTSSPNGFASLQEAANAVQAYYAGTRQRVSPDSLRRGLRQGSDGRWRWHWDPRLLDVDQSVDDDRLVSAAPGIDVPVLLVRGEKSDITNPENVRRFGSLIPNCQIVEIPGLGHVVSGGNNHLIAGPLENFLTHTVLPTLR
jgi:pimeloyl-ACP methyl ester carboxylesterase